ncbi:CheR family methyltransferase [Methylogaea oryzae]|uniref:Chemotaxis protein methyltransferase n=1 Tax=Methylogaea oryzae TaxID=1295382 RepID=A0A8D5AMP1_9GAMM|nr:CheR family methyltransferase [Methylogaea oryzae]BBL71280.1 chemotaxis protein methyltransferase [Methylogaea oryzae]
MAEKRRTGTTSALDGGDREFAFTVAEFHKIREMLYQHAGITLNDGKKDMVYSRLARRLRSNRLTSFQDYLNLLEQDDGTEWEAFINSLTTNLTAFYREPHHFPILADHMRSLAHKRPFKIWCCAASTGEEPYTLAMTAVDTFGTFTPPVEIVATDIDTNVLSKAAAGVYDIDRLSKLPTATVKRFFLKGTGSNEGKAKVRPELRKLITFGQLNLLDAQWPLSGPFDVIFCRNVMIYFDKDTQYNMLRKFVPLMEPHGLLFAGHSESLFHAADLFRLRGQTVYELARGKAAVGKAAPHQR